MPSLPLVIIIIILALIFDFVNGANDRANAISTVTATKALSPLHAVILASIFNFIPVLILPLYVAKTIGEGIISPENMFLLILVSGILAADIWALICTGYGIPISMTHSLIGGIIGAGLAARVAINWNVLTNKVLLAIILGPLSGLIAGALLFGLVSWIVFGLAKIFPLRRSQTDWVFQKIQIASAAFMAFAHGTNDTQTSMGVITAALLSAGLIHNFTVPFWVKITCGLVMALGTFLFGWRVMKTLGWRITKLDPKHGFSAETSAALVVITHSLLGIPLSTTHVIGCSVMGGTLLQNWKRIKKMVAGKIVITWIITIPVTSGLAGLCYWLLKFWR